MPQIYDASAENAPVHWRWATLAGPDARDFLHRVTTAQVRDLALGHGAPGCLLSAQGRIRAWFSLWNYGPVEFAFEYDAGAGGHWKAKLFETVDQLSFGENMTLADVTGLACRWVFAEPGQALGAWAEGLAPGQTRALDAEVRLCHHGDVDFGRPWVTAWALAERLEKWAAKIGAMPVDFAAIESWRIAAARPRADAEITTESNPLEAGLVEAVAPNKGCYPGQEVIEKIAAIGAPARRLCLMKTQGEARVGDAIFNSAEPPAEVGRITSAGAGLALGYLRKLQAKEGLDVRIGEATRASVAARIVKVAPYA